MQMIYGSILLASTPEWVENEKQAVTRMQAAFRAYPWEAHAMGSLASTGGCGAMAVSAGDQKSGAGLLPVLGALTIAADVRLDNRPELCAALAIDATEGARLDDAELILRAYQQWGTDCASHLLGDFAFAIWDADAGRLFCARDFVGVRPFYYHYAAGSGRFIFASDLLALSTHPQAPRALNLAYVAAALQTSIAQFQHPEHTYYQAIEKLPPAHCLTLDASGLQRWAYWQAGQAPERCYTDEREYVEELRSLLQAAVACPCRGSAPGRGAHQRRAGFVQRSRPGAAHPTAPGPLAHRFLVVAAPARKPGGSAAQR